MDVYGEIWTMVFPIHMGMDLSGARLGFDREYSPYTWGWTVAGVAHRVRLVFPIHMGMDLCPDPGLEGGYRVFPIHMGMDPNNCEDKQDYTRYSPCTWGWTLAEVTTQAEAWIEI